MVVLFKVVIYNVIVETEGVLGSWVSLVLLE